MSQEIATIWVTSNKKVLNGGNTLFINKTRNIYDIVYGRQANIGCMVILFLSLQTKKGV